METFKTNIPLITPKNGIDTDQQGSGQVAPEIEIIRKRSYRDPTKRNVKDYNLFMQTTYSILYAEKNLSARSLQAISTYDYRTAQHRIKNAFVACAESNLKLLALRIEPHSEDHLKFFRGLLKECFQLGKYNVTES